MSVYIYVYIEINPLISFVNQWTDFNIIVTLDWYEFTEKYNMIKNVYKLFINFIL